MDNRPALEAGKPDNVLSTAQTVSLGNAFVVAFVVLVALAIIYSVGFEPAPWIHNAFHNVRHASGFPCH